MADLPKPITRVEIYLNAIANKKESGGNGSMIEKSNINGNIVVDGEEMPVYDDTNLKNDIAKKADNTLATQEKEGLTKLYEETGENIDGAMTQKAVTEALNNIGSAGGGDKYASKEIYGDTLISLGRETGTKVGEGSFAFGSDVEASGEYSFAVGTQTKASGPYSHAEGAVTQASSDYAHAEGANTKAFGQSSHAEGEETTASGHYSHAEGYATTASNNSSHAEGVQAKALGNTSHAEGNWTTANGDYSHAEGEKTTTGIESDTSYGIAAHAEGSGTTAAGNYSHAEGYKTRAGGNYSHAEGNGTKATAIAAHAEGHETNANSGYAHAEGNGTTASGPSSHAEGDGTTANGNYAHAEGNGTTASGPSSHAEGEGTTASSENSHAEGNWTTASGQYSHAEGNSTIASGTYSHAEGSGTTADGDYGSHAEGADTMASGYQSHAEGGSSRATGSSSHAEGSDTEASATAAHSEGSHTKATKMDAHAEGFYTEANGAISHAEGGLSIAGGYGSHAEGYNTKIYDYAAHVCGKFNKYYTEDASTSGPGGANNQIGDVFIIGNGTDDEERSNAFRVTYEGNVYGLQEYTTGGADYAEFIKEWHDGNPDNEDRVGYFVTVKDQKLYKANEGDYIAGITSGNPSVVGNGDEDYYWRYERDEFNRIVMEDVEEEIQETDENGDPLYDEETHEPVMKKTGKIIPNARMKISENYDSSLQNNYVERKYRPEWDYVGMVGVLPVRDDGTCAAGDYCKCGENGIATFADVRGFDTFYVIERINDNVISVILK